MTSSSLEAQYVPRRYSSTYTGTFAPSLRSLVRSLRTTFPAKCWLSKSSRLESIGLLSEVIGKGPVDCYRYALLLDTGFGVPQDQPIWNFLVVLAVLQHQRNPLLTFFHLVRGAFESDAFDVGNRFLPFINRDLQGNRLDPVTDRFQIGRATWRRRE